MNDETLFAAALDKPDSAARAAYLDSACPDPETRKRLEALLAAHDRAGDFLARPAMTPPEPEVAATKAFAPDPDADHHTRTHGGTVDTDTDDALGFLAPPRRPDSLGRIGHYEVLEVLGRGGFGIVFRAFDEVLQRVVAVKVLAPSMAVTSPARKRFLREARSSAQVRHENVVQVFSVEEAPLPYLVMEFIPGETLQQRLDRIGPLDVPEILRIGRQVAAGLAAAHETGLIHRDIKPSNILIDNGPQERVKITDFGLARAADDASISQSGVVAGTPMYMAPEQAKGDTLDHRADLFSLGSALYVMCTGRPPFRASGTLAVLKRVCEEDPRPIREVIPEVPEWLCRVIEKLHAKDPADRFQTAKEVSDVLTDCERQLQEHQELRDFERIPGGALKPASRQQKRNWALAALLPLLLLPVPFVLLLRWQPGQISDWVGVVASGLVGLLGALFGTALLVATGSLKEIERLQIRRRWRLAISAALVLSMMGGVIWARPYAMLHFRNQAEVAFVSDPDVTGYNLVPGVGIVGEAPLMEPVEEGPNPALRLGPGAWQMEAKCQPGRIVERWEVTTRGLFTNRTREYGGERLLLTVGRGERMAVRPVLRDDPSSARPADGFVSLFNGKDLTGWKHAFGVPHAWTVRDGAIVGDGPLNCLATERLDYRNFHLRVEVKVNAGGDSGIYCRGPIGFSDGVIEAQILNGDSENPTGTLLQKSSPLARPAKPAAIAPDQWFTYEIIAQGKHIETRVNGRLAARTENARLMGGPIGLESFTRGTVVQFRKIEIKELPQLEEPAAESQSVLMKAFTAADKPLDYRFPNAGTISPEDGGWKIVSGTNGTTPLFGVGTPNLRKGTLTVRAKMKSANLPQNAYLGMGLMLGNQLVVSSPSRPIHGVSEWAVYESSYVMDENHIPDGATLNLIFDSRGTVWIKDLEVLYLPAEGIVPKAADQWVQLFNGKDLTGWSGKFPEAWSVENGILIGRGKKGSAEGWSELIHARNDFQDFHLRARARINASGWASLRLRKQQASLKGYKVWLSNDPDNTGARTGRLDVDGGGDNLKVTNPPEGLKLPVDQWFTLDLTARGPELVLSINGQEAARVTDATFERGEIQLEVAGADTVVQFQNIEIQESPTPAAPPSAVAPFDAKKAREHQEAWAKHLGIEVETTNSIGMKLRLVPPGEFTMGSPDSEPGRAAHEGPPHKVVLTQPFGIGVHPVTVGQFRAFVKAKGYLTDAENSTQGGLRFRAGKWAVDQRTNWQNPGFEQTDENPVACVSWNDAQAFCEWLSALEGRRYTLPTEAQWEYACRSGSTAKYHFGDDDGLLSEFAWYGANSGGKSHRVGTKKPNAWGLYDMHGSLWQWTMDRYAVDFYRTSPKADPQGPQSGVLRVVRGGSWFDPATLCRSAHRGYLRPSWTQTHVGFRVAVVGDLKPKPDAAPNPRPRP